MGPVLAMALAVTLGACDTGQARAAASGARATDSAGAQAAVLPPLTVDDTRRYREIAQAAWRYFESEYQRASGLVNAVPGYHYTTLWDVGAQLLAFVAARDLGLVDSARFTERVGTTLATLEHVSLFGDFAFNRFYSTKDASLAAKEGQGVSATDLGRLFMALHVVAARHPEFADLARRIVARNDLKRLVKDGYMLGYAVRPDGSTWSFQEGRIGYEQYVATGFSQWGADVRPALSVATNAQPVTVLGVQLPADKRSNDRLLSEPFILYGMELGLTDELSELARRVLQVQEARFRETGLMTIASEDAVALKPYYFYYYCVYCNAKPFVIGVSSPARTLDGPRWVSTKAAYGWDALFPGDYTKRAVEYVQPAFDARHGWATGVDERTRASTATYDINTNAVLLEIAAYQLRGRVPLARAASPSRP